MDGLTILQNGEVLHASKAVNILTNITDANCTRIGLNPVYARPEWYILTEFPVPPPQIRPSSDGGQTFDDLTHMLGQIIHINNNLRKAIRMNMPQMHQNELYTTLSHAVANYFHNENGKTPTATYRSGKPYKSLHTRLSGKAGRVRGNLMGKRCDFTSRSVITGDPTLQLDQLGVPKSVAMSQTYPEIVQSFNLDKLSELVANGPSKWPGANFVVQGGIKRVDLREKKVVLQIGDTVERHLMDNDVVIFNRQPSLHKMSMMGHRVKVLPYSTFRLNLSATTPYNADFDGDEMNMHTPQSPQARAEVKELMMVDKQIVSPQSNRPVIGIVQDALVGCFLLSHLSTFLTRDVVMELMMVLDDDNFALPPPAVWKPVQLWTGKQILSKLLPANFYVWTNPNLVIRKGDFCDGVFDKATTKHIIHLLYLEYSSQAANTFISDVQKVANQFLLSYGFSVGIADCMPTQAVKERTSNLMMDGFEKVTEYMSKPVEREPGHTVLSTFEANVNAPLNDAIKDIGREVRSILTIDNRMYSMVAAGSKGTNINLSQVMCTLGQQNVQGKRLPCGFKNRVLPHFCKYDSSPQARGFVVNSYLAGLTPQEVFFHAMGGREGLIDTAVKTAETGYLQRQLVKAMEDVVVAGDGTVRNSLGEVVQFKYGDDEMDATYLVETSFRNEKVIFTLFLTVFYIFSRFLRLFVL